VISLRRQEEERLAAERRAAEEREAAANEQARLQAEQAERSRLQAEEEGRRRTQAEAERQVADAARLQAEAASQQAEAARADAMAQQRAALEQQQALQAEAEKARLAAQQSEQARLQAETQREQMRARLMQQLNQVLQTRESARGLIVNMSDVLFDTGKYTLRPAARERMARIAGIVLAYPDLKLQVEGHTDSVGSDQYNQQLSERRAESVREYLVNQGIAADSVTAQGLGKSSPVAPNTTAEGRSLNRRVELIVSGEAIGTGLSPDSNPVLNAPGALEQPLPVR
jgi:outer membrane protein OmpA-like peptidoglycan-associated protein